MNTQRISTHESEVEKEMKRITRPGQDTELYDRTTTTEYSKTEVGSEEGT